MLFNSTIKPNQEKSYNKKSSLVYKPHRKGLRFVKPKGDLSSISVTVLQGYAVRCRWCCVLMREDGL